MGASMVSSKNALTTRAFQQLPKEMRRRTASHNVKRVPKRLRARAVKEMKADNTPTMTTRRRVPTPHQRLRLGKAKELKRLGTLTKKARTESKQQKQTQRSDETALEKEGAGPLARLAKLKKDTLSHPLRPPARYRKRQIHKSWLPTHVWHAKRAKMTEPKEPLWRFAIPITPTAKCFRVTHRASSMRGCVAWDMSYMGSIGGEGVKASLIGLLRGLGVDETLLTGKKGEKWRAGTRSWEGWIRERGGESRWIAPLLIVWCAKELDTLASGAQSEKKEKRMKLLLRIHPSAFLQVWNEVLKVAKIQRPPVMIEDLRFEIGSIEITGPGAMEALIGVLHPVTDENAAARKDATAKDTVIATADELESSKVDSSPSVARSDDEWVNIPSPSEILPQLHSITNPSSLPSNAFLAFNITDPRLQHPPRTIQPSENDQDDLLGLLSTWPPDRTTASPAIFDRTKRLMASRLSSQKAINRRKGDAGPGSFPPPLPKDPEIPVMLLVSRTLSSPPKIKHGGGGPGCYTLLLPWSCVQPLWYSLMHYPLSTGATPQLGGLQEKRQMAFESQIPWFPGDFPGTRAGWAWELKEREVKKSAWDRKPKGKRCEWDSVDLGSGKRGEVGLGWGCDWEKLISVTSPKDKKVDNEHAETTQKVTPAVATSKSKSKGVQPSSTTTAAKEQDEVIPPAVPLSIYQIPSFSSSRTLSSTPPSPIAPTALIPIHLTLIKTGHPSRNARIYRLPTTSPNLRARWLAILASSSTNHRNDNNDNSQSHHEHRRHLPPLPKNAPQHLKTQRLAASLLAPPPSSSSTRRNPVDDLENNNDNNEAVTAAAAAASIPITMTPNHPTYPPVPDEIDLIGFVTSTNFHLGNGRCEAIGNVVLRQVLTQSDSDVDTDGIPPARERGQGRETEIGRRESAMGTTGFCIVRDAGHSVGRLARWRFI